MSSGEFLTFNCKLTDRVDLKRPIEKYVAKHYGREQASDILTDIEEVSRRRTEVVAVSGSGTSDSAKDIYISYYRALSVMETRFPISRDSEHAQVPFFWTGSSTARRRCKQMNIHFEKAAVLFNTAAVLSKKAAVQNRENQEGYKLAIQYFQEAAGTFALVRETALKVDNPKPSDLTSDFLTLAEKVMLAQGQECVFWRALKEQKSAGLLCKIAKQASILHSEALALVASPAVKEDLDKTWQDLIQSKSWLFEGLCQYQAAEESRAKEDIAVEICRLNQAVALLEKLQKSGKFLAKSLLTYIKELISVISQRQQAAEKDNASIYLRRIPPFNELPQINGVQIVKSVQTGNLDASEEHLFSDLIPEPIAKALSRYSDLVDRLIRNELEKLNGATDEARLKLKQYELPEILAAVTSSAGTTIPEPLKQELEDIERTNGLVHLLEMNDQLSALKANSVDELNELEKALDEEVATDVALREQYGNEWNASSSTSQSMNFRKLISAYRDNIKTASNSDKVIEEKLNQHKGKFGSLSVAEIISSMPKLEPGMINTAEMDPQQLVANMNNCVQQLGSTSEERAVLEDALKEMKNKDELLSKLVATGVGSHEELFKMELEKYDPLKQDVSDNLDKQKELLDYLTQGYNTFQQTFDIAAWRQQTDTYFKEIKANIAAFCDVRNNVGEGMKFYMNLKDAIDRLKQQINDFLMSRKFDREERLELQKAKEKSQQDVANTPPPPPPPVETSFDASTPTVPYQSYSGSSSGFGNTPSTQVHANQQPSAPLYQPPGGYAPSAPSLTANNSFDRMVESPNPYNPPQPPSVPSFGSSASFGSAPPPPSVHSYSVPSQFPSPGYAQGNYPPPPPQPYAPSYQQTPPPGVQPAYNHPGQPYYPPQNPGYPPQQNDPNYPYQNTQQSVPPPPGGQYYSPPNYGHPNQ